MTNSNLIRYFKKYNIPYQIKETKELNAFRKPQKAKRLILTVGMIDSLIEAIRDRGMISADGRNISRVVNATIKKLEDKRSRI